MLDHDKVAAPSAQVSALLSRLRAGMLGIEGASSHMRPMTHFVDEDTATLWFLTSRETDLAAEIGEGATAHYCLVGDAEGSYACLRGPISPSDDTDKLDELWSAVAAAWFSGRDDPNLMLLKMPLREGEVWTSTDSRFQFGLEIAKANLDPDRTPDVGDHAKVRF